MPWQPTTFIRYEECITGSSTHPAVIMTDQGRAFLKALNNPIGPPALVREWVGTRLAAILGLDTFDMAIMNIDKNDEIPLGKGHFVAPGLSLVTRAVKGHSWGGDVRELNRLDNPDAIPRLVVFDTWTRNRDRHPPEGINHRNNNNNVFFSGENATSRHFRLIAMDHTECFESTAQPLNSRLCTIDRVKDAKIYGLFDEFRQFMQRKNQKIQHQQNFLDSLYRLHHISNSDVEKVIGEIPRDWDISDDCRAALLRFIVDRAHYLWETFRETLGHEIWPGEILM